MRIVFFTSHHFIAGTEKQKLRLRHSEFSSDIKKQYKLIFRNTEYNIKATVNCKYSNFRLLKYNQSSCSQTCLQGHSLRQKIVVVIQRWSLFGG
jgi:hypothetical protein